MKTKQYLIFTCCRSRIIVLFIPLLIFGGIKAENRLFPVSVSVLNQSWAFPMSGFTRFTPLYPGVTTGIFRLRADRLFSFPQSAHLGYFYNNVAGSAAFLYVDQGIHFSPKCGFYADISLGLGYMQAFHPRDIYRKENDVYEKVRDLGKPSFMFSFSQSIGYDLTIKFSMPIAPFIKYQWIASYPYFDMVFPIRPSSMVHLGTLIYF